MIQGIRKISRSPSAYSYQLLVKQLLLTPILYAPDQEIVYQDRVRLTYKEFYKRIHRLASGLMSLGVKPGDTVAVLDWDSHRYLECFFAIPMMGAILHTVNVRLSPEQILYTMNHAEDNIVLAHSDFIPMLEDVAERLETVRSYVLIDESKTISKIKLPIASEYEQLLSSAQDKFDFPDFDEDAQATTFYTTG
ncbi:MAG: AMP-binding protein, partial [Desulfomonilaceae bacterium]